MKQKKARLSVTFRKKCGEEQVNIFARSSTYLGVHARCS